MPKRPLEVLGALIDLASLIRCDRMTDPSRRDAFARLFAQHDRWMRAYLASRPRKAARCEAIAVRLAAAGAKVACLARNQEKLPHAQLNLNFRRQTLNPDITEFSKPRRHLFWT